MLTATKQRPGHLATLQNSLDCTSTYSWRTWERYKRDFDCPLFKSQSMIEANNNVIINIFYGVINTARLWNAVVEPYWVFGQFQYTVVIRRKELLKQISAYRVAFTLLTMGGSQIPVELKSENEFQSLRFGGMLCCFTESWIIVSTMRVNLNYFLTRVSNISVHGSLATRCQKRDFHVFCWCA